MENKELFDDVEVQEDVEEVSPELESFVDELEVGELSDASSNEVQLREEDKDKVFVIESAEIKKPMLKNESGLIPPKAFNEKKPDKKGYVSKLKIIFKDSDYVSLLGKVRWYIKVDQETGKKKIDPWFQTTKLDDSCIGNQYVSPISQLYYKVCKKLGKEPGKISQAGFVEYLVGRKVKLSQYSIVFDGKKSYRIDISEIIE